MSLSIPIVAWTVDGTPSLGKFEDDFFPVFNLANITTLIGGASTALDSVITAGDEGANTGTRVVLRHSSGADLEYVLIDAPGAEVVPWRIRPDDYDGATNDRGWDLRSVRKDGLICAWDKSDNTRFYRLFVEPEEGGVALLKPDTANPFTITT